MTWLLFELRVMLYMQRSSAGAAGGCLMRVWPGHVCSGVRMKKRGDKNRDWILGEKQRHQQKRTFFLFL